MHIYVHNYDSVWEFNYISEEGFYMYLWNYNIKYLHFD